MSLTDIIADPLQRQGLVFGVGVVCGVVAGITQTFSQNYEESSTTTRLAVGVPTVLGIGSAVVTKSSIRGSEVLEFGANASAATAGYLAGKGIVYTAMFGIAGLVAKQYENTVDE